MYSYKPSGVCSTTINFDIKNNIIKDIEFVGGCPGNLLGIKNLVVGMSVEDVITKLQGISCRDKGTSCPDQLSKALLKWKEENK